MVPFYCILLGGKAIRSFVGSIQSAVACKATIHNIATKLHSSGLVLDKKESKKKTYWLCTSFLCSDICVNATPFSLLLNKTYLLEIV
jgi:hypothetical protein